MKVVCIDNMVISRLSVTLTEGKVYNVINKKDLGSNFYVYTILDDSGLTSDYNIIRFKPLEEIREIKLNIILGYDNDRKEA